MSDGGSGHDHIEGQVLLLAGAKASVAADRLPGLVADADAHLVAHRDDYRREFERVHEDGTRAVFLAPADHWDAVGEALGFGERETDALRRVHAEQLLRLGRRTDRREEFETALEIRDAVVLGV